MILLPSLHMRAISDMRRSHDVRFPNSMHRPDTIDLRIMKEIGTPQSMQWNIRESYASIAKRVGVDEETVRKRIKRQEKLGAIQGWRAVIHPNLVGCVDAYVDLEVNNADRKEEIISQLKLVEGVIVITSFEGKGLFVMFYSEPGEALSRKVQLICSICGTRDFTTLNSYLPRSDLKLSVTDWKIIWAIKDDPRKNLSEIAKEARVATRTVNRRLTLLTERRAFFLMGLPNFRQLVGTTGNFLIFCSGGNNSSSSSSSTARSIVSRFENIAFAAVTQSVLMCNIFFHNLSEAEQAYEWIKRLEGVAKARMRIMKELIFIWYWLDDQIEKRFSQVQ
jgi:DNA-binding Lrp family transcriptional regulator